MFSFLRDVKFVAFERNRRNRFRDASAISFDLFIISRAATGSWSSEQMESLKVTAVGINRGSGDRGLTRMSGS